MIHQTRLLGVLILYFVYNMVFVNYTYDMVINTQLHKFYGKSFAPVLYFILDAATQFCEKRYTVYSTT